MLSKPLRETKWQLTPSFLPTSWGVLCNNMQNFLKIAPSTGALPLLDYFIKSINPIFSIIKLYKMEQQQDLEKIHESPKHQENFHHGSPQWKTLDI